MIAKEVADLKDEKKQRFLLHPTNVKGCIYVCLPVGSGEFFPLQSLCTSSTVSLQLSFFFSPKSEHFTVFLQLLSLKLCIAALLRPSQCSSKGADELSDRLSSVSAQSCILLILKVKHPCSITRLYMPTHPSVLHPQHHRGRGVLCCSYHARPSHTCSCFNHSHSAAHTRGRCGVHVRGCLHLKKVLCLLQSSPQYCPRQRM